MSTKAMIAVALLELGHKSFPGESTNPEVLKYFTETGFEWVNDDETPWCAAFMNWVALKAGYKAPSKLTAQAFLKWGQKTTVPELGDVVVFWRDSPGSWKGHVGIYIKETNNRIVTLGGNQNNEVSIVSYPKTQVLGYRSPENIITKIVKKIT